MCVQNALYGLFQRQLACNLTPAADSVLQFTTSILPWFL